MNTKKINDIIPFALDIVENMFKSGAEVGRVEDALCRILTAYGAERVNALSIPTGIILTVTCPNGESYSHSRRITGGAATDFEKLDKLNSLSREICRTTPDKEYIKEKLDGILFERNQKFFLKHLLGAILITGGFAFVFGGGVVESVFAAAVSVIVTLFERFFKKNNTNMSVYYLVCSLIAGLISGALCSLFGRESTDIVIICYIMVVIPGLSFSNAAKDIMLGDLISGSLKMLESVLYAGFIAGGIALSLFLPGGAAI